MERSYGVVDADSDTVQTQKHNQHKLESSFFLKELLYQLV